MRNAKQTDLTEGLHQARDQERAAAPGFCHVLLQQTSARLPLTVRRNKCFSVIGCCT